MAQQSRHTISILYKFHIFEEEQAKKGVVHAYIFSILNFLFVYILGEEKTKIGVVVKIYNFYSAPISYLRGGTGQKGVVHAYMFSTLHYFYILEEAQTKKGVVV